MKTPVDAHLREQARSFELRFACEDCAHFVHRRRQLGAGLPEQGECSLSFPAAPRQEALEGVAIEFCKAFELA